jgi:hypothetical protein
VQGSRYGYWFRGSLMWLTYMLHRTGRSIMFVGCFCLQYQCSQFINFLFRFNGTVETQVDVVCKQVERLWWANLDKRTYRQHCHKPNIRQDATLNDWFCTATGCPRNTCPLTRRNCGSTLKPDSGYG